MRMTTIGFIGLGNMGLPMAQNLIKAGHKVQGFDVTKPQADALAASGGVAAPSVKAAASGAEIVITMLPAGQHVRDVYLGEGGVLAGAASPVVSAGCPVATDASCCAAPIAPVTVT